MTRDEFLTKMVEKGKLTQARVDNFNSKKKEKDEVKAKYSKTMTKAEMQALLDILTKG
jgi:hypothetical protein